MSARILSEFKKVLNESKNIAVLTGAGVSAESGIGTFRGPTGIWRTHNAIDLATPEAFASSPSLVWEFYQWRRSVAFDAKPNNAHIALAKFEEKCNNENRTFTLLTQNVDGLHIKAGSKNVLEIHGSLRKVICTKCKSVDVNLDQPICEALRGRGNPNEESTSVIPISELPKCGKCGSLIRPYVVWFGENLDKNILAKCREAVESCDIFLVVGTSSVVYPAASFAPSVADRGKPVAEFNIEDSPASSRFQFYFPGQCGTTLPVALST